MNYSPLSNRIVGKMKKRGERTLASGIVVPVDVSQSPYVIVEVVAVGRGHIAYSGEVVKMETKIGDKVMLVNMTPFVLPREGNPELADDEDYVVFQESDIYVRVD